jgi:hypothetical protein
MWYREIPPSPGDDAWHTWINALGFPRRHQPLEAQVEHDIEDAIKRADEHRLSVWRGLTLSGIPIWAGFRKRHLELDERWDYRRNRYLVWRVAALKTLVDREQYYDPIDGKLTRDKLLATYREFWPLDINGRDPESNISLWEPRNGNPFHEYAADVLSLFSVAFPNKSANATVH